jgi:acyl carrier protein
MPHDIARRLSALFERSLHATVPTDDTDLLDSGVIDSLSFVTLLAEIEREFEVAIPLLDLDFDRVKTLSAIAELVRELQAATHDRDAQPPARRS